MRLSPTEFPALILHFPCTDRITDFDTFDKYATDVLNLAAARLREGLPVLGFLNPLLYKIRAEHPDAFNDITVGNNPGCGTEGFNVRTLEAYLLVVLD